MTRPVRRGLLVGLGLAATAGFAWTLAGPGAPGRTIIIDPTDPALVAHGAVVYARECASCHGAALEGQPDWRRRRPDGRLPAPPHDETGHTWHHPDPQLFAMTKEGLAPFAPPGYRSDMPAFGGRLSDRDIRAALAYIKSRWPAAIRERQAEITRRAAGTARP